MVTRQEILNKKKPSRTTTSRREILSVRGLTDEAEYVYRWVNDTGDRIMNLVDDGYTFVDKKGLAAGDTTIESARGTDSLMRKGVGGGTVAYLMKIPRETFNAYKEEQRREDQELLQTMQSTQGTSLTGSLVIEQK